MAAICRVLPNMIPRGSSLLTRFLDAQVLAAAATSFKEPATKAASSWAGFLAYKPSKPAVETLLARMHSSHSQVAVLLQLGRLHEASKLALKAGNPQTVRLVLDEAKRARAELVAADCQAFLHGNA